MKDGGGRLGGEGGGNLLPKYSLGLFEGYPLVPNLA